MHSRRMIVTGTGSKAFGVFGGIVLGSRPAIDRIARTSRAFAGSTPLPIALAAGWRAALRLLTAAPDRWWRSFRGTPQRVRGCDDA